MGSYHLNLDKKGDIVQVWVERVNLPAYLIAYSLRSHPTTVVLLVEQEVQLVELVAQISKMAKSNNESSSHCSTVHEVIGNFFLTSCDFFLFQPIREGD